MFYTSDIGGMFICRLNFANCINRPANNEIVGIIISRYSETQVIISKEDLQELVKIVEKVESINIVPKLSEGQTERRESEFERKILSKIFISQITPRTMTDEEFDEFERMKIEGEPLSEQIIRERR